MTSPRSRPVTPVPVVSISPRSLEMHTTPREGSRSRADLALSAGGAALGALKVVLEAVDTLPVVKYLAGISVTILETIEKLQAEEKSIRDISDRANSTVLTVAQVCQSEGITVNAQLESDLRELIRTMEDILRFTQQIASRPWYKKMFSTSEDASFLVSLDTRLTHAFQLFELRCNVNMRTSQQTLIEHVQSLSRTMSGVNIADQTMHVTEGLYVVSDASKGRLIEAENSRPTSEASHVYAAPAGTKLSPYQLWTIFRIDGTDNRYIIRSLATGAALDERTPDEDNRVALWWLHGEPHQIWEFVGVRRSELTDYCAIRSANSRRLLDATCPAGSDCDYLHLAHQPVYGGPSASQQWRLIRYPWTARPPRPSPSLGAPQLEPVDHSFRRGFYLQNAQTGHFVAARDFVSAGEGTSFSTTSEAGSATTWWFLHATCDWVDAPHEATFAFVTGRGERASLATLDHWGKKRITVTWGNFHPDDPHHLWAALPRDHGFVFRNRASGKLLCEEEAKVVAAVPESGKSLAYLWRLVDVLTENHCPVLYDSTLSIMPHELAVTSTGLAPSPASPPPQPVLHTNVATAEEYSQLIGCLELQHKVIRDMLSSGYTSLVVLPQLVRGCKDGEIHDHSVVVRQQEDFIFPKRLKGADNWDTCKPKEAGDLGTPE
ncbi:ricin B lectin domain-containing protein [Phanerochaete sordida]|uniref:Ricin B lectin domain-containing protein n=1 Tax=Phanerochaete sordida TaxID=48140 RepID=A0A9P3G7J6_9APHY|nr:ricin B lectin domain-containing protein [Phanerochaete sordida]